APELAMWCHQSCIMASIHSYGHQTDCARGSAAPCHRSVDRQSRAGSVPTPHRSCPPWCRPTAAGWPARPASISVPSAQLPLNILDAHRANALLDALPVLPGPLGPLALLGPLGLLPLAV